MIDHWAIARWPIYDPRPYPLTAPEPDYDAQPVRVLCLNEQWVSHVIGVMYRLTRADAWQGDDDERLRAIEQAERIIAAMARGMDCAIPTDDDAPTNQPSELLTVGSGGITLAGDDDMGQVVTEVKIVDGKLRIYYGHCCYDEIDISSLADDEDVIPQPGDDDEIEIPTEIGGEWVSSSCVKATQVMAIQADVVDSILDAVASRAIPQAAANDFKNRWPGIVLGQRDFLAAYTAGLNVEAAGYSSEAESANFYQTLKCHYDAVLDGTLAGVTASQYEGLKSVLDSLVQEWFHVGVSPVYGSMRNLHRYALRAIGENDIRNHTSYLKADGTEDCECPGAGQINPAELYEGDWAVMYDFTGDSMPGTASIDSGNCTNAVHNSGIGVEFRRSADGSCVQIQGSIDIGVASNNASATVGFIWIEMDAYPTYDPSTEWYIAQGTNLGDRWASETQWDEQIPATVTVGKAYTLSLNLNRTYASNTYLRFNFNGYNHASSWEVSGTVGLRIRRIYVAGTGAGPGATM